MNKLKLYHQDDSEQFQVYHIIIAKDAAPVPSYFGGSILLQNIESYMKMLPHSFQLSDQIVFFLDDFEGFSLFGQYIFRQPSFLSQS